MSLCKIIYKYHWDKQRSCHNLNYGKGHEKVLIDHPKTKVFRVEGDCVSYFRWFVDDLYMRGFVDRNSEANVDLYHKIPKFIQRNHSSHKKYSQELSATF